MFIRPTVLVLGAGASFPLDYPLGNGLVNEILTLHNDEYFRAELATIGKDLDQYKEFQRELRVAMPPSIDYFLECRPEYLAMGKLAIAYRIIVRENDEFIFDRNRGGAWYRQLIDTLGQKPEWIVRNKLSVITFNYDRSFEHALFTSLKARFRASDDDTAAIIEQIPIVHIYGQVGALPWQSHGLAPRDYGFHKRQGEAQSASTGIEIIFEKTDPNAPVLESARTLIDRASHVFVWGFGFHEENCRRIGLSGEGKVMISTQKGITRQRASILADRYKMSFCGDEDWDIPTFMDRSPDYLTVSSMQAPT